MEQRSWLLLAPRHAPDAILAAHLEFALKWEGVNLTVLAALGKAVPDEVIRQAVLSRPHQFMRRAWFIHEWLTGRTLDIPAVDKKRSKVNAIDQGKQFALLTGAVAQRQRVSNNIPGTPEFAPLVTVTQELQRYGQRELAKIAREVTKEVHPILLRAPRHSCC